jgi:hypothetical protein
MKPTTGNLSTGLSHPDFFYRYSPREPTEKYAADYFTP